jgi:uncharacterized protein (UPF0332 family)
VTNENQRRNIADEVARAEDALKSADILQQAGQHADAVSPAYYGCFHYARALLLMHGEEPRRHGGIDRLLQRDLVSTGKLAPEIARNFARLQQYRLHADYTAGYAFTAATAADELDTARVFCVAARTLLVAEGWLA